MAEIQGATVSKPASADLSSFANCFVKIDTSGNIAPIGHANDVPIGVLDPNDVPTAEGQAAKVHVLGGGGIVGVKVGTTPITIGVPIGIEYVSGTDAGKATALAAGQTPSGIPLQLGSTENQIIEVLLTPVTAKA